MTILSTAYLGNTRYYSKLIGGDAVVDINESYQKQSYRNRCRIASSTGVIDLIIPVVKNHGKKTFVKDVEIEYVERWQQQHWRTLVSAYKRTPFFDYYEEFFIDIYQHKERFLLDFNNRLQEKVLECLNISPKIEFSNEYIISSDMKSDFRNSISPKSQREFRDDNFKAVEYFQPFSDRLGFVAELSIIDLLFCEGPQAVNIINKSIL